MFKRSNELYDLFYESKDYAGEATRIRGLVQQRLPGARTLLDVACGTGRHLEHLARWFEVEGLDAEPGLLEAAKRRLPSVDVHQKDMRDFDLSRRFDVVTCLFSSIGYVRSLRSLQRAVRSMARHVAPRGLLIVEPWLSADRFDPSWLGRAITVDRPDIQAVRLNSSRVQGRLSILQFHYLVARPGQVDHFVETHTLGLFSDAEYRRAFEHTGLSVEHDPEGLMGRGLWIAQAR